MTETVATVLARTVDARLNCRKHGNAEWKIKHEQRLRDLVRNHLPSGSGWDSGTTIDLERSTGTKLVFTGGFHHMDDNGGYDVWTEHTITVRAHLFLDLDIEISGRDLNDVKDLLHGLFYEALQAPAPPEEGIRL
jgi:hypothetical protein